MAGRLSDTDIAALLNNRFGAVAVSTVGTYYLGLSTTTPTTTGTNITEPSGSAGYARVAHTNNTTNWPTVTGRSKTNGAAFTFAQVTADWGTPTYFILMDASTGGAMRAYGPLTSPQAIVVGTLPSFPAGSIVITAASS